MSIDLSLTRIRALLSYFLPYTRPTIHIAGTNGKGSVSALLTSILCNTEPPFKVGRFNSPHLTSILDSITIDNKPIPDDIYDVSRAEVEAKDSSANTGASSFELLTVTALLIFERANVDIVICEVGMGGRLDATNVIPDEAILLSVITAIDLDHQAFLGNTVSAIAREKAGIIRRHKIVVLGPQRHPEVIPIVSDVASSCQSKLIMAQPARSRSWNASDGPERAPFSIRPFIPPPPHPVRFINPTDSQRSLDLLNPLHGDHQLDNLGTAMTAISALIVEGGLRAYRANNLHLQIKDKAYLLPYLSLREAILRTNWPGRLSFHNLPYNDQAGNSKELVLLVDGAHNTASSERLATYISRLLSSLSVSRRAPRKLFLTYIIALSHSPPKSVLDVIHPLLSPHTLPPPGSYLQISIKIAALRFTPPDGMPWVNSVSPSQIQQVSKSILPSAETWYPENDSFEASSDALTELNNALQWATKIEDEEDDEEFECLAIVAGSLYLVADLYRLLKLSAS